MEPNLFRNRWLALAFVGLVAIGAAVLVGSEGEAGLLDRYMAGKPGERTITDVDDSCAMGVDALAFLRRVREELSR